MATAVVAPDTVSATPPPVLGVIGEYSAADLQRMHVEGGAGLALVELRWSRAEPAPGRFDLSYLDGVRQRIGQLRAAGYAVALNPGVQNAPPWVLDQPGARYVDQFGQPYMDSDEPNLVFGLVLRPLAVRYLRQVFARIGRDFSIVRAGGGHWGELTYPARLDPKTGRPEYRYYAFDVNALRADPVPAWRPGQPSPRGESTKFLTWYLDALAAYQNWQIVALREAGYAGTVAVLYPSFGMRAGDFERAVATNLAGVSNAERNGEVQRGYDAARQIAALTDPNVVVYGTWAENPDTIVYLTSLARARHRRVMAETSHSCLAAQLPAVMRAARANRLAAVYVVRLPAAAVVQGARYLRPAS
ncbi:beta-galactosidase [Dactylosporangium sp. CA-092794]|uniref:beta-galactosidase n=1 Tax=Dactylosporangium sp. CA-092794 TaxID=3239929 RepID=UPI003D8ED4BC